MLVALLVPSRFKKPTPAVEPRRPANWAVPLEGPPGFTNLFRVSYALYRAAQPSEEGLQYIRDRRPLEPGTDPIQTIVSLREFHDEDDEVLDSAPLVRYERIKFDTLHPEDDEVVKFLRIATTKACQPVLLHCAKGADRTGMMVAIFRIVVQGWNRDEALLEMMGGGYGYHLMFKDLPLYVEDLDVDGIKSKVAVAGSWKHGRAGEHRWARIANWFRRRLRRVSAKR
jgi:hypothetical protein